MLLGYANVETIGKNSKSVLLQCFLETQNLSLESKNVFEIFQKHYLRLGRNFDSATMFPRLHWP